MPMSGGKSGDNRDGPISVTGPLFYFKRVVNNCIISDFLKILMGD